MKEELPSILVTDGWITDENDALVEVVIPSTVETYQAPTKIKFLGETINWIPNDVTVLQEFEAPNVTTIAQVTNNTGIFQGCTNLIRVSLPALETISKGNGVYGGGIFRGCTSLTSISFPSLKTISCTNGFSGGTYGGVFYGCSSLTSVSMPELTTIDNVVGYAQCGVFAFCTALTSISFPKLTTIDNSIYGGVFWGCTALATVEFPKIQTITSGSGNPGGAFNGCSGLQSVTLGSVGNPVTSIGKYTFQGCTQSGLTITIYTSGGASLANQPWGATNAAVVYESA